MSVNLVSGKIGTMVTFFILNDNPSEMICTYPFEWNAPHSMSICNKTVFKMINLLWKAPVLHAKTKRQVEDQLLLRYVN